MNARGAARGAEEGTHAVAAPIPAVQRRSVRGVALGPVILRIRPRPLIVAGVLAVAVVALACAAVTLGDYRVPIPQLLSVLSGTEDGPARMVVLEWRGPRVVAAVLFGAALALSGAVFQALTRNPLGSPDIIGFSTGSYTGVVAVLALGGTGYAAMTAGALAGGLLTALLVYLLAFRGGMSGLRFIIVGIAASAFLSGLNTWFSAKADVDLALQAAVWGAGSLGLVDGPVLAAAGALLAVIVVLLAMARRSLDQLELGDEIARGLGVRVEPARLLLVVLAIAAVALVTACCGPIAFVALAAPHIARRLSGRANPPSLVIAALAGSLLLLASDVVAQHAVPGIILPVGAVTVSLGGAYLVWLLAVEARRRG